MSVKKLIDVHRGTDGRQYKKLTDVNLNTDGRTYES